MARSGRPQTPKLSRREQLDLAREMGAERFQRFLRYANRRLLESVRDCKADNPRSKAETTRTAVDAFVKLESLGKTFADEDLAVAKIAEALANASKAEPEGGAIVVEFVREDDES